MNSSLPRMPSVTVRFVNGALPALAALCTLPFLSIRTASAQDPLPPKADPQMQAVLDKLASLGGKPIESLSPEEARKQPTPADAVKALMKDQGKSGPEKVDDVDDIELKLSTGDVKGRLYKPAGEGPFPVILYIHGGGWVIADLDTYDATPRALANATGAIVISTHYRQAPEYKFPAALEDTFGAYVWTLGNAHRWNANTKKVAIVGESAGGNMAAAICMMAKEKGVQAPVHQVLVYPVADTGMDTPSYLENANAKPLNAPMMKWFAGHTFGKPEDAQNPLVALLKAKSFQGLPSATIITAQIDPLRSEGEALAQRMKADGVEVSYKNYDGVAHEFFGMAAVVDKAKEAQALAAANLKAAFAATPEGGVPAKPAGN